MKPADLLELKNYPSILIYGPAGTGKTALVSQAPKAYLFDFDNGMRTAALMDDKYTSLRLQCEFDTYMDKDPFNPTAYMAAEKKLEEFQKLSMQDKLPYDFIIIDSLTGLAKCLQLQVMMLAKSDPFAKPFIQDWGTLVNTTEKILTILRSLKCTLLVTAHEVMIDVDGSTLIRPLSVTKDHGKNKLAWLFDEVLHTKLVAAGMGKWDYKITGQSTLSILARTRSTMTEDILINELGLKGVLERIGYK